jgi:sulfatase modifying factor 1
MMGMLRTILILLVVVAGLNPASSQDNRQGKDFALFFAVENYSHWPILYNPIDDAEEIAQDLKDLYGFETEVVKNPSRNQIYDKLDTYQRKAYAKDAQLLIFFSGHGDFIEGKGEGFFIPRDGKLQDRYQDTYLPHARLQRIIDNIPCPHILLAIDACYSGTFDEQVAARYKDKSGWGRPNDNEEAERKRFIENSLRYRSRLFLTSGGKERTPDPSAFAEAFKTALRAFGGQDRILEYAELYYQYLQKATPMPRFGEFGANETGSNFLFVLQGDQKASTANKEDPEATVWRTAKEQHTIEAYRAYLQFYPNGKYKDEAEKYIRSPSPPDDMIFVQGGSFQMGSEEGRSDEKPVHTVTVSDFYMARFELTVEEFSAFVQATGYRTDAEKGDGSYIYKDGSYKKQEGINWRHDATGKRRPGSEYNHPVIHVSWNDAVAYCNWRSEQEGYQSVYTISGDKVTANWDANGYRLPTEAEWEFASRSRGGSDKWAGTSSESELGFYANYWESGDSDKDGYENTAPVGSFRANNA